MDIISKNRFLFWTLILLAVCNIITISAFWLNNREQAAGKPTKREDGITDVKNFIGRELDFSVEQKKEMEKLFDDYQSESKKIKDEIHRFHTGINEQIVEHVEYNEVAPKFDTLGAMKSSLDKASYTFFYKLYRLFGD